MLASSLVSCELPEACVRVVGRALRTSRSSRAHWHGSSPLPALLHCKRPPQLHAYRCKSAVAGSWQHAHALMWGRTGARCCREVAADLAQFQASVPWRHRPCKQAADYAATAAMAPAAQHSCLRLLRPVWQSCGSAATGPACTDGGKPRHADPSDWGSGQRPSPPPVDGREPRCASRTAAITHGLDTALERLRC